MNFCQKSENVMHELVSQLWMQQDSLHSFIYGIVMQEQGVHFLKKWQRKILFIYLIFHTAYRSWAETVGKQIIFLLH